MDDTPEVSMVTSRTSSSPPLPPPLPDDGLFLELSSCISVKLSLPPPPPPPGKCTLLPLPPLASYVTSFPIDPPPPPPFSGMSLPTPQPPPPLSYEMSLPSAPPPPLPSYGTSVPAAPPLPSYGTSLPAAPPLPSYGTSLPAAPPLPSYGTSLPAAPPLPSYGTSLPAAPPLPSYGTSLPAAPLLPSYGTSLPAAPPLPSYGTSLPAAPPLPSYGTSLPAAPPPPSYGRSVNSALPPPSYGTSLPAAPPLPSCGTALPASPSPPLPSYGTSLPAAPPPPPPSYGTSLPAAPPLPSYGTSLHAAPPPPPPSYGTSLPAAPPLPSYGTSLHAAPPPPPPSYGTCLPTAPALHIDQRRPKLRNFNWDALPADRVLGGRNLWTCGPQGASLQINVIHMEELFGQREEPRKLRGTRSFKARSNHGIMERDMKEVSLLDAKKSMNLGIFLKQFKRPVQVMIADIKQGVGSNFGAEKMGELLRLLPEKDEMKRLRAFKGDRSRLSDPEHFMVMLVEIPSFHQRLQVMILKEEFFPQLNSLKQAVEVQMAAATELLQCEDLHVIIHLVLKAGNYMNAGGYAGSAMGFRMGSLLRLADTKANKPGMNLMHFVAGEAERNNRSLLTFPEKLPHISQASRITSQEVENDLETLSQKLQCTKEALRNQPDLRLEMAPFLQVAEVELCEVFCCLQSMKDARRTVMDYFCEDESTFRLEEMCLVFTSFCAKFMSAIQENREREKAEHRKERLEKRRSIASCSSQDKDLQDVELEFLMLRLPRRSRSSRGPRPLPRSHSTEVLNVSPTCGSLPKSSIGASTNITVEPIREEDDLAAESQSHGLRRPRGDSTESECLQETPGKINRRHTVGCLPSYKTEGEMRTVLATSPGASSKESLVLPCESVSSSSPCTPNVNSLNQVLRSWTADSSQKDPLSPTSGTPSPFRLGGLFHRRGSLKSPEPLTISLADGSPRGGSEASALTTFLRRFDNALRSPK
ncbi:uncharacterized protein ACNLHF_009527 [Anomaloglossus baeobatrachus]|uniref:uncharacterized protein LOC142290788 n=1 Tax=Anomaloglossus baeobatrachus TaxID=238106 RepID=UPI003F4F6247